MSARPKPYLSAEDYLAIDRAAETRSEYFDGEIFAMSGGSFAHSRLQANLIRQLGNRLAGKPCVVNTADLRVKIEASNLYTYPDISVVCGGPRFLDERQDTLLNPVLIVEVLSPSTERYDRGTKFRHYRQIPSLMEYVLVSQDEAQVERFLRTDTGDWTLRVASGLESRIQLASIGEELPLAEIYEKVELPPVPLHDTGV